MIPLLALLLVAGPHKVSRTNLILGAAFTVAIDVDRATSIWGLRHEMPEGNRLLGRWPTESQVNAYILACYSGALLVTAILPSKWRNWWLGGLTIMELGVDRRQIRLGIPLRF